MDQETLSSKVARYIQNRAVDKLQKFDKESEKKRNTITDSTQLALWESENQVERHAIESSYLPVNWLTDAATRAKQISIVTHALKFTHTDAKGSSIYATSPVAPDEMLDKHYLTTASLRIIETDAVGNAAALDVANLLQLQQNSESLIACIACEDSSPLQPFAESDDQLRQWMNGFQQVLKPKELSSHTLAKQLFFPVSDTEYHLLSPLFASSLVHEVHQRINATRYNETAKAVRKAKREKKYISDYVIDYPQVVIQNFGGTKPQNVSQLNSQRGGKSYLFNSSPPSWDTSRFSPPHYCIFKNKSELNRRAWRQFKELQQYLLSIHDKGKNKPQRLRYGEYLDGLMNTLLAYVAQIQKLSPGWSVQTDLPRAQQLWLDPKREDADFTQEYLKNDWKTEVMSEYARWLSRKIKHEKLTMADPEYQHFRKELTKKLRSLKEDLEVTL